ncbi:hypothetical protein [Streptomyces sp. NPDC090026]|uniref:hypothetical protein n=1 Tax=Streptomyces sp. NPDC090026 TaxID=3365923 RepID=UPI0037FC04CA
MSGPAQTAAASARAGQAPPRPACRTAPVPDARQLTTEAYAGRACYACGQHLEHGGVAAGRAVGRDGAHDLSAEVYACP